MAKRIVGVLILIAAAWIMVEVYHVRTNNNRARELFKSAQAASATHVQGE